MERGLLSSCGAGASHSNGFSCCRAQALGVQASVVVVTGFSCPVACGIFLGQGWNLCPLRWQVDSLPLDHQGRPRMFILMPRCVIMGPAEPIIFTLKATGLRGGTRELFSIIKMFRFLITECNTSIFICQNSWKCTLKMHTFYHL